jgi:hypothetical protein
LKKEYPASLVSWLTLWSQMSVEFHARPIQRPQSVQAWQAQRMEHSDRHFNTQTTMAATPQDSLAFSSHGGIPTHAHVSSHPIPVPPIDKKDEFVPCGPGHQRQDSSLFLPLRPALQKHRQEGPCRHYLIIVTH